MSKITIKTKWDYSKLAAHYDQRPDYSNKLLKKILKIIKCKKNFTVADIGAGTGKLTKILCKNNLIVNAVEPNANMRFIGKKNTKNFKNLNWSIGTAEKSSLKDHSIYCVFFGSSFNTADYKKTFKEIKRILIHRGYFCCMWNYRYLKDKHQKAIENLIFKEIPNYNYGDRRFDYKKFLSKQNFLSNVNKISHKFNVKVKKNDFINAWKSHGTLRRNCESQKQFDKILKEISSYVKSIRGNYLIIPYENVAYIARIKRK